MRNIKNNNNALSEQASVILFILLKKELVFLSKMDNLILSFLSIIDRQMCYQNQYYQGPEIY